MKKENFLKIVSSVSPKEMHKILEDKDKKQKPLNVVTIVKNN